MQHKQQQVVPAHHRLKRQFRQLLPVVQWIDTAASLLHDLCRVLTFAYTCMHLLKCMHLLRHVHVDDSAASTYVQVW